MKSSYKRLGEYIRQVDVRNRDLSVTKLMGVSIQKVIMSSIANTIGTDMSTYKIVEKNQFVYGPVTSRNGDKVSIAIFDEDIGIVSQAYTAFEVIDHSVLLPEYLMRWFMRSEFDRYARFMSHGSAREIFGWSEMCDVTLPVPDIAEQQRIVDEYNAVKNRIALNEKMIAVLEQTAGAVYRRWFVDFEFPDENGNPYKSSGGKMIDSTMGEIPAGWKVGTLDEVAEIKGGKRLPKGDELVATPTSHPYIKVADMGRAMYATLNETIEYIDEETFSSISRYTVSCRDVILSIVGTIGLVGIIDETLHDANLTENCVKLTKVKFVDSEYLYLFLSSKQGQNDIVTKTVGGVQGKLPLYNISRIKLLLPDTKTLHDFSDSVTQIGKNIRIYIWENIKLNELCGLLLSKLARTEG